MPQVLGSQRRCTDVLFSLLLLTTWVVMTYLGLIVTGVVPSETLEPGNPQRLVNGIDYDGRICGVDSDVKGRSSIYFVSPGNGVCVDECPSTTNYKEFVCLDEVQAAVYDNVTGQVNVQEGWVRVSSRECLYHMASKDILNYCVFDVILDVADKNATKALEAEMAESLSGTGANFTVVSSDSSSTSWFEDIFADLLTARAYIGGFGIAFSTVAGVLYLMFLRVPGVLSLVIWALFLSVWALLGIVGVVLTTTAKSWAEEEEPRTHSSAAIGMVKYLGYLMYGSFFVWLILMLWLRKRITIAIAVTKEAARAVNDMKALVLFPVTQTTALLIFMIPWGIFMFYLASSVEVDGNSVSMKGFKYNDNIRYAALYFIFVYFWTSEFLVAMGQIIVAMAVATWYFTRDKASTIGNRTVYDAITTSLFYHSGTAAFGSLIIAIIRTIRAILSYIQKKCKNTSNRMLQMVLSCVQCLLWCLEKCMKFLNKNAYIQTAIFGYSFLKAAKKAFYLIARNIVRVAAVGMVSEVVLILGRALIPLTSTFVFYLCVDEMLADELHGLVGVTLVTFLVSLFVANMFTEIFGMAISTILQCFIADEEMFRPESRYGEGDLAELLHKASTGAATKDSKIAGRVASTEGLAARSVSEGHAADGVVLVKAAGGTAAGPTGGDEAGDLP